MKPPMPVIFDRRQHRHDAEDRDGVGDRGDDRALGNRAGHVALRVLHLLGRAVLQLEADEPEDQQRHQADEDPGRGREVAEAVAVHAVLDRVHDHRQREEPEHQEPHDRAGVRDPLAVLQRHDRHADADPDEDELERVVADGAAADAVDVGAPGVGGDEAERSAHPERVCHPVQDGADAGRQPAPGQLHPLVRAALLREGACPAPPSAGRTGT